MSWPDVLEDIAIQIKSKLLAEDIEIDVYLGASLDTPSEEQVNVMRASPVTEGDVFCAQGMAVMKVYVEKWVRNDIAPSGSTDVELANDRILNGYKRLDWVSQAIGGDIVNSYLGYTADLINTLTDEDQYPPMTAERSEYSVRYRT